jgi:hypothetical protein
MSRGTILGPRQPRHDLTILVPRGYEEEKPDPIGRCLVPGCGAKFFKGEEKAWQMHVGKCARANMDKIEAIQKANRESIFAPWDPEVTSHLLGVGRRMRQEGRLTIKPSERAGFS